MAKSLHDRACGASWQDQVLGRGMAQIDRAFSQNDTSGRSVGQIVALGWHLGRQPEQVGSTGAGDLYFRSCLPRQCARDVIRVGGKWPKPRMELGQIVEASRQTAQLAVSREAREGLVDSGTLGEV
ncbi:Uncharacterised protein [Starkeya nomas]|uniref:Uncharacterized protein n=1 Tax=Starkeya nomas TaxID=2666134 RepID=A0A5S9NIN6_9HYPH|nr:Uncharacterised protein [Starkeya nomas]